MIELNWASVSVFINGVEIGKVKSISISARKKNLAFRTRLKTVAEIILDKRNLN